MRIKRILNVSTEKRNMNSLWKPILVSMILFSFFAFQIDQKQQNSNEADRIAMEPTAEIMEEPQFSIAQIPAPAMVAEPVVGPILAVAPVMGKMTATQPVESVLAVEPILFIAPVHEVPTQMDTSKRSKRAKKLERQMEKKAKEMEKLSKKWEKEVGDSYELNAAEMDLLTLKLNQELELKLKDLEWDSKAFEDNMEKWSNELANNFSFDMEKLNLFEFDNKEFEEKMEKLGKELGEKYGDTTHFNEWSEKEQKDFNDLMDKFNYEFKNNFNEGLFNENIAKFEGEFNHLFEELNLNSENFNNLFSDQMLLLNKSMDELRFDFDFEDMNSDLEKKVKELNEKVRELQEELEEED